ncbi:MAG: hypothetical protein E5X26_12155, partial [Mesorhizobium sp.]
KQEDGPDLLIQGSGNLIQTLLANGLIDEIRLMIFPLLLGKGKRLFGDDAMPAAFKLIKSQTTSTGVIMATYERGGGVKTGSFATAPRFLAPKAGARNEKCRSRCPAMPRQTLADMSGECLCRPRHCMLRQVQVDGKIRQRR